MDLIYYFLRFNLKVHYRHVNYIFLREMIETLEIYLNIKKQVGVILLFPMVFPLSWGTSKLTPTLILIINHL